MTSARLRRTAVGAGLVAVIAMGGLTAACGGGEEGPTTTPSTTTTPSPTDKNINPSGPNLFTPPPVAPPPTVSTHRRNPPE